ncbi:Hypothetical protein FKW44_003937 [Caligus rogercresseyi]|uniref:Reverse transcriptase domain-containing protein n=1 Tax=Caligus rogercresseyi TaxID=217165 RepID=A0A7T8KMG1_CALRO|nr:Hypothetical protein FKW44_003937 [Caligus rogercresseyi]
MALINAFSKRYDLRKESGGAAVAVFDFSTAFDTFSSEVLEEQLDALGVSKHTIAWFMSYMSG